MVSCANQGDKGIGSGPTTTAPCQNMTAVTKAKADTRTSLTGAATADDGVEEQGAAPVLTIAMLTWCTGFVLPFYTKNDYKALLVKINYMYLNYTNDIEDRCPGETESSLQQQVRAVMGTLRKLE